MRTHRGKISFQLLILIGGLALISIDSTRSYQTDQEITTMQPEITIRSNVYEGDTDIISGIWLTSDAQPVADGEITISLFQNESGTVGRLLLIFFNTTSVDGSFSFEFDYSVYSSGNFIWEYKFDKSGYQGWDIVEIVEVMPQALDIKIDVSPELIRGNEFIIVAVVTYASVGSDKFGQGVSGLLVSFTVSLLDQDNSVIVIRLSGTTNIHGVVFITLTAAETESLQEVISITAEIQQGDQLFAAELEAEKLPVVLNNDDSFIDRTMKVLENNTVLLAFMVLFFASSTIILLITRNKVSLKKEMWPEHEK